MAMTATEKAAKAEAKKDAQRIAAMEQLRVAVERMHKACEWVKKTTTPEGNCEGTALLMWIASFPRLEDAVKAVKKATR
jgi:hypothetical protein